LRKISWIDEDFLEKHFARSSKDKTVRRFGASLRIKNAIGSNNPISTAC